MEIRQNIYFILLYAIILNILIVEVFILVNKWGGLEEELKTYEAITEIIDASTAIYYSGTTAYFENYLLKDKNCHTQYSSPTEVDVYCNDKKLHLIKTSYPLFLKIEKGNDQIQIERKELNYGALKYFYITATNKKLLLFRFDVNTQQDNLNKLFSELITVIPQNYVLGFCDKDSYLIICNSEIKYCDMNTFMSSAFNYESLTDYLEAINNNAPNEILKIKNSPDCDSSWNTIKGKYYRYNPEIISFVESQSQCNNNEKCIILKDNKISFYYKGFLTEIKDSYDLNLRLIFPNFYGKDTEEKYYDVFSQNYRKMWKEFLYLYSKIYSKRYELFKEYKEYPEIERYERYELCKEYFEDLSNLLCSTDLENSLCVLTKNNADVSEINNVLKNIKETYYKEINNGCEEMVYS